MTDYASTPAGAVAAAFGESQSGILPGHPGMTIAQFVAQLPERRAAVRDYYVRRGMVTPSGEPTPHLMHLAEIARIHHRNATGANWRKIDAAGWEQIQRRMRLSEELRRREAFAPDAEAHTAEYMRGLSNG